MMRDPDDRLLLVEGPTDERVLRELLVKYGSNSHELKRLLRSCNGFDGLKQVAHVSVTATRRLGLVIDQDDPEDARWAGLRTLLESRGISLPEAPITGGTTVRGVQTGFVVGVWVMPDNFNPGALEHFLATLIPDDRRTCWDYARESTAQALTRGARFTGRHLQKAELYTWLAWQERPGWPPGHALQHGILAADSELARQFVDWYRALFEEPLP